MLVESASSFVRCVSCGKCDVHALGMSCVYGGVSCVPYTVYDVYCV